MNYLQPHALCSIISGAFSIYWHNFLTLLTIYLAPIIPVELLKTLIIAPTNESPASMVVGFFLSYAAASFAAFPLTIAVSEICLGIKPAVGRAYVRTFTNLERILGTTALFLAIYIAGLVALAIPGIVFMLWYMFVQPVVVIESLSGFAALHRSRELGRGYYMRNFGLYILVLCLVFLIGMIYLLVDFSTVDLDQSSTWEFLTSILFAIPQPIALIAIVLLYYDMRARKEAYGALQLAQDLK